jgi:hypothetical protein
MGWVLFVGLALLATEVVLLIPPRRWVSSTVVFLLSWGIFHRMVYLVTLEYPPREVSLGINGLWFTCVLLAALR